MLGYKSYIMENKMKVDKRFLLKHNACGECFKWFVNQKSKDIDFLFKALIRDKKSLNWANWYLCRRLKKLDRVKYAVFSSHQILPAFEEKYPDNYLPRKLIEATEKYIKNPIKKNKENAARISSDIFNTVKATRNYHHVAFHGAFRSAYYAIKSFSNTDFSFYGAPYYAAASAACDADEKETMIKIIQNGIKLLKGENK